MKRWITGLLAGAAVLIGAAQTLAQDYPARTVRIIVPAAAGGGVDLMARLVAENLSQTLGQQFLVENVAGANGNIGTAQAAAAEADGLTLLFTNSGNHVTNPGLFKSLNWDPVADFAPVAMVFRAPFVIVGRKDLEPNTLSELVAYAKSKPGELNYASPGIGSGNHILLQYFSETAGIDMTHVPYKGSGPAITDLLGGQVDLFANTPQSLVSLIKDKSVKPYAITSKERQPLLPDLPTTGEAGLPGLELDAWYALYAPDGTPPAVVSKLAAAVETYVKSAPFQDKAAQSGGFGVFMGPAELGPYTKQQVDYWTGITSKLAIRLD